MADNGSKEKFLHPFFFLRIYSRAANSTKATATTATNISTVVSLVGPSLVPPSIVAPIVNPFQTPPEAGKLEVALAWPSKNNAYIWQERWNESGYDGLIPRFAGGKPSKLSEEQKLDLKERLSSGSYTTEEVRKIIHKSYGVEYTSKQVRIIMRKLGLNYAEPFQQDYRRPADAEEQLKKTSRTEH